MTLRPTAAGWFEVLTAHKDLARAMEALSRTGAVELEAAGGDGDGLPARLALPELENGLKAFHDMAQRYRAYWPEPTAARETAEQPHRMLAAACKRLDIWRRHADPIIAALERLTGARRDLERLDAALAAAGEGLPDLSALAGAGPRLQARLVRLAPGMQLGEMPALVLFRLWDGPAARHLLALGRAGDIATLDKELAARKANIVPLPSWLPPSVEAARAQIARRRDELAAEIDARNAALASLSDRLHIAAALGDIALTDWIGAHAHKLSGSERLAWVTGWTSDANGAELRRALDAAAVRYVLRMGEAPGTLDAPMILDNPGWARGFEVFARMLGVPARDESDPAILLAVIVPVMFGFMFGDVGQGLVICAAGLVLARRYPILRILVPGGLMAIAFGFIFGSVFSREDIVAPLWLAPLEYPVEILIAAVVLGAAVLALGLLLDAVQMHWRSAAHRWWGSRAGLALAYLGLLATPFHIEALAVAALGLAWFVIGAVALSDSPGLGALARGSAEAVEEILRLLVNTVSFARIGAFALAHAGLSAAIVDVAQATGPVGYWIVLALGNVLVIALEGLVVGIQTTRLMLFEFFIRFLSGSGRAFTPLPPPDIPRPRISSTGSPIMTPNDAPVRSRPGLRDRDRERTDDRSFANRARRGADGACRRRSRRGAMGDDGRGHRGGPVDARRRLCRGLGRQRRRWRAGRKARTARPRADPGRPGRRHCDLWIDRRRSDPQPRGLKWARSSSSATN